MVWGSNYVAYKTMDVISYPWTINLYYYKGLSWPLINHLLTWINFNPMISNHMSCKVWDEITYQFSNFNGCAVEILEWISNFTPYFIIDIITYCPACRTTLVATRFRVAVICPIIQVPHCIRVFFYFVWFVFINHIFNFIMNYVPIVTFWIFTYHKIWILSIMFCFIWSYWIVYFLACLEVSWRVVS